MLYTDSHEWVLVEDGKAKVGITQVASKELETIVNICLPKLNQKLAKGDEVVILESTKAASDSYAPISGTVLQVNPLIVENPSLIHKDPQGLYWLYQMSLDSPKELEDLLSKDQYFDSLNASV